VIDTHAHLDGCADPPEQLLARAREAGVDRVIAIGTGVESGRAALATAEREQGVYAAVGVHPHDAATGDGELGGLREALAHERAVAVGEIGLDYFRDYAPRDAQRALFDRQLELADELELPVVIHTRAADRDTAAALAGFRGTVVLHCFSSPHLLPVALERGYFVSFAGNVTYKNATDLRLAATEVPADRLLAETDCPYLAPEPRRGRPNEPAYVTYTVAALARARGEREEELAAALDANATAAFSLP